MPNGLWGSLDDLSEELLVRAISNGLYEGQSLDFKRECYGKSDSEKRNLLRDVVSMTNGGGGMILIGIDEDPKEEGRAASVTPIHDADTEAERLYATCLSGIEDHIPGIAIRSIPVSGGFVIALRCPRSFRGPHMVKFKEENRFWIRHGKTNQRMTVREIRDAFGQSKSYEANIRSWAEKRRTSLRNRKGEVLLHIAVAPYGPLNDVVDINDPYVRALLKKPPMIEPYLAGTEEVRPTLSGLTAKGVFAKTNRWEIQLSRSGVVSLVALLPPYTEEARNIGFCVTIQSLVKYAVSLALVASALFKHLGLTGSFVLFLDLFVNTDSDQFEQLHHSLRGYFKAIDPESSFVTREVIVPESVVESLDRPHQVFHVTMDKLWNSFGEDQCPYFDANSNLDFGGSGPS